MKTSRYISSILFILWVGLTQAAWAQKAVVDEGRAAFRAAQAAEKAGDYPTMIAEFKRANDLRPQHPTLVYFLARAYAIADQPENALQWLHAFADMGMAIPLEDDSAWATLAQTAEGQAVQAKMARHQQPLNRSERAFSFGDPDFIPEGIAYDAVTDAFFVSGVRGRQIVRVKNNLPEVIINEADGLWSGLAVAVDEKRRWLWVTSVATRFTPNASDAEIGRSALFQYDLDTDQIINRYELPEDEDTHGFSDFTIASDGRLYITDHNAKALFILDPHTGILEEFVPPGFFVSPEGIVLSEDETRLYIADYAIGLCQVDLATRTPSVLDMPPQTTVVGIDGLVRHGDTLIGIQNGTQPYRVVQLTLDAAGNTITRVEVLAANHPDFDEPTLGTMVGNTLYYVANSQWGHFDQNAQLRADLKRVPPQILKIKL